MQKKKEIELLIARYRADIAALEEKEDDLLRQSEMLENLIPNFLASYMEKVMQTSQNKQFSQDEYEADVKRKLENLKKVLRELQTVVGLVKEEKEIMIKRIEELEIFLANEPTNSVQIKDKLMVVQKPEKSAIVDPKNEKKPADNKFEGSGRLPKGEDANLKKVCEDLQKQVIDLTKNLNNFSQKLTENKDHVKKLEKKCSNLKRELQAQNKKLEEKGDILVSEDVVKDKNQALQVEHGSKGTNTNQKLTESKGQDKKLEEKAQSQILEKKANTVDSDSTCKETDGNLQENKSKDTCSVRNSVSKEKLIQETGKETSLADKPEPCPNKNTDINISVQKSKNPRTLSAIEDLQIITSKDQLVNFDKLLKSENTDWKQVHKNLQNQIFNLNNNLKITTKKLLESKEYVKSLEEKYSNLKKDLQVQIQVAKENTDSLNSEEINKEQENNLNVQHGKKDIIPAMLPSEETSPITKTEQKTEAKNKTVTDPNIQELEHQKKKSKVLEPENTETAPINKAELKSGTKHKTVNDPNIQDPEHHKVKSKLVQPENTEIAPINNAELRTETKHKTVTDPNIQELEHHKVKSKVLQSENTDWKKICEDLQKQVIDFTENLKSALEKLKDREVYIKHLEEENSKLEKGLQAKVQLLDKNTDSLISTIVNKEQEKNLRDELESKRVVSTVNEALSDVRSMKEALTKSTKDKDDDIIPLVKGTDVQDSTSKNKMASFSKEFSSEPKDHLPENKVLSESTSLESQATADIISSKASQGRNEVIRNQAKSEVAKQNTKKVPETSKDYANFVYDPNKVGAVLNSDMLVSKETIPKPAESELPGSKTLGQTIVLSNNVLVIKNNRKNTGDVQRREIEILIARYRADIAGLEERKEDLMRHIEILENLIPVVQLWLMSKVFLTLEVPLKGKIQFPQPEVEEEAKDKLNHLETILGEFQQTVDVIQIEEQLLRKRIDELETLLANQPPQHAGNLIDIDITSSNKLGITDIKHRKKAEGLKTDSLESKKINSEEILNSKNTDWENVYRDLVKQVSELRKKLNNASQKLKEGEDYVKSLEEEYTMLEKELKLKVQLLENRTGKASSDIADEKQEKYLQEVKHKEALSATKDALAKDIPIEPLVTEAISEPAKGKISESRTEPVPETTRTEEKRGCLKLLKLKFLL